MWSCLNRIKNKDKFFLHNILFRLKQMRKSRKKWGGGGGGLLRLKILYFMTPKLQQKIKHIDVTNPQWN